MLLLSLMLPSKIDFIGVGFAKSGTTLCANLLDEHPEICMSIPKEVQFFNDKRSFYHKPYSENRYKKGETWYYNHWAHSKAVQKCGEISPQYIMDDEAMDRIAADLPNSKIIVCLRNPANTCFSFYGMALHHHKANLQSFDIEIRNNKDIFERAFYYEKIKKLNALFPSDKIFYFVLEEFQKSPEKIIKDLYRFIGVDDSFLPTSKDKFFNAAAITKSIFLRKFEKYFVDILSGFGLTNIIKFLKKNTLVKKLQSFNAKPIATSKISPVDRKYIYDLVYDDMLALSALTGKDFSFWFKMDN